MAPGATELVSLTIAVGIALLTKSRMVPAVLCELVAIVGASLMVGLPESNRVGRFSGYTVFFFFRQCFRILPLALTGMLISCLCSKSHRDAIHLLLAFKLHWRIVEEDCV